MKLYNKGKVIRNVVIVKNRKRWKKRILITDLLSWNEGKNKNITLSPDMVGAIINLINFSKNP